MGLFDGKGETVNDFVVGRDDDMWVYQCGTHTLRSARQLNAPKIGDAGIDLPSNEPDTVVVRPGYPVAVRTGVSWEADPGLVGFVCPRSGLALSHGLTVVNAPGVVDAGYTGEIVAILATHGREVVVEPGDRVAQFVVTRSVTPAVAPEGSRGTDGFGSTGV